MDPISNRYDFVYLFDVADGNPNGDPDAGNMPRVDPETGQGLVTDVCLKRKIRNYVFATKGNQSPHEIYVLESFLADQQKRAFKNLDLPAATNKNSNEKAREWMCANFFDVRAFGAVMSTGKVKKGEQKNSKGDEGKLGKDESWMWNCGQVLGPVQITFARSVDRIVSSEHTITRKVKTNADDDAADGEQSAGEMGHKATIPYALYKAHGFVNVPPARRTGFNGDDLQLLWEALKMMFDFDRSAVRGMMSSPTGGLIIFKHESALGNAPAAALFGRVQIERKTKGPARAFVDYTVSVDDKALPKGVEIVRM
jgi:CRISPR-associated protein Csd2